jgi:hypothetical protein
LTVLLRNKRSPRLQRWFEGNALTETLELTHEALRDAFGVLTADEVVASEIVVRLLFAEEAATRIECATATIVFLCPRWRLTRRYWECR